MTEKGKADAKQSSGPVDEDDTLDDLIPTFLGSEDDDAAGSTAATAETVEADVSVSDEAVQPMSAAVLDVGVGDADAAGDQSLNQVLDGIDEQSVAGGPSPVELDPDDESDGVAMPTSGAEVADGDKADQADDETVELAEDRDDEDTSDRSDFDDDDAEAGEESEDAAAEEVTQSGPVSADATDDESTVLAAPSPGGLLVPRFLDHETESEEDEETALDEDHLDNDELSDGDDDELSEGTAAAVADAAIIDATANDDGAVGDLVTEAISAQHADVAVAEGAPQAAGGADTASELQELPLHLRAAQVFLSVLLIGCILLLVLDYLN